MKRLLAIIALMFAASSVHASMIWMAVAVDAKQVGEFTKNEELLAHTLLKAKGEKAINLDKAWHGIHYLLNGTAWEVTSVAGQAILGGKEFGTDMGYGPPRVLSTEEVKKLAKALSVVTSQQLSARYDPQVMEKMEIYPTIIWRREGTDALKWLLDDYAELSKFYRQAAEKEQAVIIVIM
ncbi:YfbM family protein [Undibacterium sp. MH2W]|uniref:YfbM family protein n=1 Tax=Undibacterium sp. MH2W TaxID=3413044 RepID=UPI003BF0861E